MSSHVSLKVLIVGGGIGGPALAFWLAQLGHDVTIVERNSCLRAQGQQIDIRGQGVSVIRLMGLEPEIRARGVDEAGIRFVDHNGKIQAAFGANKTGVGRQSFTSEFEIMRSDLVRLLFERTEELGVKYIFGNSVVAFEQDTESVTVSLSDGTTDKFDLLVGADGQSSRTRRLMLGSGEEDPFFPLDLHTALFTVPREKSDVNWATVCLAPKQRMMMTRNDNPETTQVYLGFAPQDQETDRLLRQSQKGRDIGEQKRLWIELFKDAGWQVPRFTKSLEAGGVSDDFYQYQIGQVKMDKWYKNRVVLLGDAGYGPSPLTGSGTTLAFVGAYVLAGEISEHCAGSKGKMGVSAALKAYDSSLRPFVKTVQDIKFKPTALYPKSAWGVSFVNTILWLVAIFRIDKLFLRLQSDNVEGWNLPDYPALPVKEGKSDTETD
ncbi:oxidoreductase [Colletotrichum truncatum]|uniref:Oxidoreductase n=1 Tax=Colletotrichum truncatum TaxID=5467 RepID=A0ACC3YR53_COLTU|nr:oxidoreductase [Colletotrichum truncatum]KAF6782810.1 oxidoreductase [Colletotrichum truncatum]